MKQPSDLVIKGKLVAFVTDQAYISTTIDLSDPKLLKRLSVWLLKAAEYLEKHDQR